MTPRAGASRYRAAALLLTLIIALLACAPARAEFRGTQLTAGESIPGFELTDQFGHAIQSDDYRGRVVLLTFLYTHCPDVCPIVTGQLRETSEALEAEAAEMAVVAVSVDPERDTVEAAREYSDKWRMSERWEYLVGSREELAEVWAAFYVDPVEFDTERESGEALRQGTPTEGSVDALREGVRERYLVTHGAPVYLIDRKGVMRVVFTPPLDVEAMVHDVRVVLE